MDPNTQTPAPKKSASKKWLWLLLLLLIAGAVAAYFLAKDDNSNNTTATTQPTNQTSTTPANTFTPESMANTPYIATISSTSGGKTTKGTLTSDGQGNTSYAYSVSGQSANIVYTKDAYYFCMGTATCIKYPISQSTTSGFDPSQYQYDTSRIENLKNTAAYKGQQACPSPAAGTCDVWSTSYGGFTSTMYINTENKRIVKVSSVSGTTTNEVTYDYQSAKVTVPTKFTTLSNNH